MLPAERPGKAGRSILSRGAASGPEGGHRAGGGRVVGRSRSWALWAMVGFLILIGAACDEAETPASEPAWGSEAVDYFGALAEALTEDDFYGVLDFFEPTAAVEDRTSRSRGAVQPVTNLLLGNRADLARELLEVHLGPSDAVAVVRWPDSGDVGAVVTTTHDGLIAGEVVFLDADSLLTSLRAAPETVARYETLYRSYAAAWESGDPDGIAGLYAEEATVRRTIFGDDAALWATVHSPGDGDASVPMLFLDPLRYGDDSQRAIGLYEVTSPGGCSFGVAIRWDFSGDLIVREDRYVEVASTRLCDQGGLPEGWWSGLVLPGPRDLVVTGTIAGASGVPIAVHNGTPDLDAVVEWGLERFRGAGLAEPRVDSVTFEPTRMCEGVFGRVVEEPDGERRLFLCIDGSELCSEQGQCGPVALNIKMGVLHELGHAWMLDHTDSEVRTELLHHSGRSVWSDEGAAWLERGVEYAAEVLAWGLVDEPVVLVRLADPPCRELAIAFEILTGSVPQPAQPDCT